MSTSAILIDICPLEHFDICFDDIAFFQLVLDVDIDVDVLIEFDILAHLDRAARWAVADLHVDRRILFDLDGILQENVQVEHAVDVEDFEVDIELLIDTHFLIEHEPRSALRRRW